MSMTRREALQSMVRAAGTVTLGGAGLGVLAGASPPPNRPTRGSAKDDAGTRLEGIGRALAPEPFEIDFGPEVIQDLHRRLDSMRWPEMPFDTGWASGTNDRVLRELVEYWRTEYDWFAVQARLNERTHLRTPVEGEYIHTVVYERAGAGAPGDFPLLLLHGWPGSFHEFSIAAPRLAAGIDGAPGFHVIVPSLPGFGFSDAPRTPGMGSGRIAERLHGLMGELGYERYGVQGGDWGAIIGTQMARRFPESVVGFHMSFVASAPNPPAGVEPSAEEVAYREARARFSGSETGYSSIQGSRPQSLGYAQQDSPVGWLAWMLEKYWAWSDHGGDLWSTYTRDDILTTAMLYWLPGRVLSAARIYHEPGGGGGGGRVVVPTGYARFPGEPWGPPREVAERTYNIVHYNEFPRGGHFPALEQPAPWSGDVARFFASLR